MHAKTEVEAPPATADRSHLLRPAEKMFEIGFFAGAFLPAKDHELYDSLGSFQTPFDLVGPKGGLRLGFFPMPILGVEMESGYVSLKNRRNEQNHLFDLRGHAVLQGPWRVSPFVVLGGGLLGVEGEAGGDIDDAIHWGGGVKVFVTPHVQLRFDARHIISGAERPGSGNTSHFETTAGLGFVLFREDEVETIVVEPSPKPLLAEPSTTPSVVEPEPAPPEVVVAKRTLYVEPMDPVQFGFDSADLPPQFQPILLEVVKLMTEREGLDVVVIGHADAVGTETYNQMLSERRAKAVALFLVLKGVPKARIRVRGEGEHAPIAPNATPIGRAQNRRTELTVVERRQGPADILEAEAARSKDPGPLRKEEDEALIEKGEALDED